jgi:hypothetical protein
MKKLFYSNKILVAISLGFGSILVGLFIFANDSINFAPNKNLSDIHIESNKVQYSNSLPQKNLNEDTNAVTKKRVGTIKAELDVLPFYDSVEESDLIAKIKIKDMIQEINDPTPKTIFDAEIIEKIKDTDENNDHIKIMQQGNTEWIFNNNRLFEKDDVLILFLKKAVGLDNTYWILGEETNFYEVADNELIIKPAFFRDELTDISSVTDEISSEKKVKGVQFLKEESFKQKIKDFSNLSCLREP